MYIIYWLILCICIQRYIKTKDNQYIYIYTYRQSHVTFIRTTDLQLQELIWKPLTYRLLYQEPSCIDQTSLSFLGLVVPAGLSEQVAKRALTEEVSPILMAMVEPPPLSVSSGVMLRVSEEPKETVYWNNYGWNYSDKPHKLGYGHL